jgi:hypothetical protein
VTTEPPPAHALSVRTFLLGDPSTGDDVTRLGQVIEENGFAGTALKAVGALTQSARAEFAEQLAAAIGPLLEIDFGDVLVLGWTKHREVTDVARRTLKAAGTSETVYLVSHQITSTHHPLVELFIDDTRLHTFTFDVAITVDLAGAALTIQSGRLLDARFGRVTVTAELRLQDMQRPLVQQQRELDLRPALRFGDGIPLVRQPVAARIPSPAPGRVDPAD